MAWRVRVGTGGEGAVALWWRELVGGGEGEVVVGGEEGRSFCCWESSSVVVSLGFSDSSSPFLTCWKFLGFEMANPWFVCWKREGKTKEEKRVRKRNVFPLYVFSLAHLLFGKDCLHFPPIPKKHQPTIKTTTPTIPQTDVRE